MVTTSIFGTVASLSFVFGIAAFGAVAVSSLAYGVFQEMK